MADIKKRVMREIERAGYVDPDEIAQRLKLTDWQTGEALYKLIRSGKLNPPEGMDFLATGNIDEANEWGAKAFGVEGHPQALGLIGLAHATINSSKARGETLKQAVENADRALGRRNLH